MKLRRILSSLLSIVFLLTVQCAPALATETKENGDDGVLAPTAACVYVMDVDSGRVLYARNEEVERPIASITKIMTALLLVETVPEEEMNRLCTVSKGAWLQDGTSLYLEVGEEISLRSLLYGTLLRSGNDCAYVIAEELGGSEKGFCELMNAKAAELGMTHTHYASCNGLVDENNYSCARDMAILGRYVINNPRFAEVCGTRYYKEEGYNIKNHNRLLLRNDNCIGIKTGFTTKAGRTLVSCGKDPETGARVVVCTLKDSEDFNEHEAIYNWYFDTYDPVTVCKAGEAVTTLTLAEGQRWALLAQEDLSLCLTDAEKATVSCSIRCLANDPTEDCKAGEPAGTLTCTAAGETYEIPLIYGEVAP